MSINHAWSLTKKERQVLEALGEIWLHNGAQSFGCRVNNRTVFQAVDHKQHQPAEKLLLNGGTHETHDLLGQLTPEKTLRAQIELYDKQDGELFIKGLDDPHHQKRLDIDANFLSNLGQLQNDFNTVTAELVEKQDQLEMLYQLSQTMRCHLEIQPLFSSLIRNLQEIFHTSALITLISSGGLSPIVSSYPNNSWLDKETIQMLQGMHAEKKSLIINKPDGKKIKNLLFLHLDVKDPFQASFAFANKSVDSFKPGDLKLAQVIGEQISAQFEYVQLHQAMLAKARLQAEADMARNVQMQLLPSVPPTIAGLDLFAQSKPASQVGGDFYIFMPDAELPLFVLGDVSGKGMPAALLMTMLRSSFQSAGRTSKTRGSLTADVLNDTNRNMHSDFETVEMFATGIVAAYDPETRELSYSSAGHSPVIYCPAEGEPVILPANGPAMGIFSTDVAGLDSIILNPNDILIICTDGFNEAWNTEDEIFGYDRLLSLISDLRSFAALEIAVEMYLAIETFSNGREQDDDQTLIVIKGVSHDAG
ncbi:MAG: SpoIIE family protein phosphatase [Anaerolineae bacterium]